MNRNVLLGLGAIALVTIGFVISDTMKLRSEVAAEAERPVELPRREATERTPDPVPEPKAEPEPQPQPEPTQEILWLDSGFEDYPAPRYTGPQKPLQMTEAQRNFRTRLRDAYDAPVSFGGSLNVAAIGCGTSCVFYYMIDKSSGKVLEFPLGGESQMGLRLNYRANSALIWAKWEEGFGADRRCRVQPWVLGAGGFRSLSPVSAGTCD